MATINFTADQLEIIRASLYGEIEHMEGCCMESSDGTEEGDMWKAQYDLTVATLSVIEDAALRKLCISDRHCG